MTSDVDTFARSRPFRRLRARTSLYAASVAIVAWAAATVPLPFVEYVPGSPPDVAPLIEIDGTPVSELDGRTSMLTVVLRQQPTVSALTALLAPHRELHRMDRIYPPGIERDAYLQRQRDRFGRQFEVAAAVGARAAGVETEIVTEVVVVDVVEGGPAEGVLERGDVVLEAAGTQVTAAEGLQEMVRSRAVGEELDLLIERDGQQETTSVRLGAIPGEDGARIGIAIHTAVDELHLPFVVRLAEDTRIGGPSAGLIVGLTVYDLLADENLLAGRIVAATGSLDADGSVGPVGGVAEKMRAAADIDADVVFVPHSQLDVALSGAPDGLQVIGVNTLDEAIEALRTN